MLPRLRTHVARSAKLDLPAKVLASSKAPPEVAAKCKTEDSNMGQSWPQHMPIEA